MSALKTPCSLEALHAVIIGGTPVPIWGMNSSERLRRSLARAGIGLVDAPEAAGAGDWLLMRADWVYDEALVGALAKSPDTLLIGGNGEVVAAHVGGAEAQPVAALLKRSGNIADGVPPSLRVLTASELGGAYNNALRKREAPVLMKLDAGNAVAIEKRLFSAAYKGVTDLITKYVWPLPARHVTKLCAQLGISPNQVTFASLIFVFITFTLFWQGMFGWGLVAAYAMTFLDTVDGKLARVTLTSSTIGNVFDHGIDLVHPPFWWWAWIVGLAHAGFDLPASDLVLGAIVGGYILQRIEEGIFIRCFKIQMHIWRPFDSRFRLITARRNPNLILLTLSVLIGRPDLGIIWVAVWTVLSLFVHAWQIVQALWTSRTAPISSWLAG